MDTCYHSNVCNCVKDPNCTGDAGYECCSEAPPKGQPKFGMWVKEGTCDKKRGICKSQNPPTGKEHIENYTTHTVEGYSDDKSWKYVYWFLLPLIFILLVCIVLKIRK